MRNEFRDWARTMGVECVEIKISDKEIFPMIARYEIREICTCIKRRKENEENGWDFVVNIREKRNEKKNC